MRHTPVSQAATTEYVHIIEASPHAKTGYLPLHSKLFSAETRRILRTHS